MRAISPSPRYQIELFHPRVRRGPDSNGTVVEWAEGEHISARFEQGGLLDHEIETALESFNFSGLPEGVNPLTRVSVFDSEAYVQQFPADVRKEMQARIDERLVELSKVFPSEFRVVEQPAAEQPWPGYDSASVEEILELQQRTNISPEKIRIYEIENEGRQEIIEAMLRIDDPEGAAALYGPAGDEEEIVVGA